MKSMKWVPWFCISLVTACLLMFAPVASAQTAPEGGAGLTKSPEAEAYDQKALKKLQKMSPEEVAELDRKLAEALTLFYDRDYARALPIFQEISGTVETMDVAFWLGSCAAKAGETDLAIRKFQDMLAIDPNLHRVRLELATVYFKLGRYAEARQELNTVLEAKPPKPVRENIEKLLASIDAKTRKLYGNFRASFGVQRDRNVSSGPDKDSIEIPEDRGTLNLTESQQAVRDWVAVLTMSGNALYDIGDRRGFMWNTTGVMYNTRNASHAEFDFLHWRVTTGPWWVTQRSIFKMPMGYAENLYEHDHLFDTWDVGPSYEYFILPWFSMKGTFVYARDTYEPNDPPPLDNKTGQDNLKRTLELASNFYLNNRRDILTFAFSHDDVNAKETRFSYDAENWSVAYFKQFRMFDWEMELYGRYKYTMKQYETNALLWPPGLHRKDRRHNLYLVLSRNIGKHYFASLSYNMILNESNTELYDFEKYIYGFNVGYKF